MKPGEKVAMHMVGNDERKTFPETLGVGHTVLAGAEAAFRWFCLYPLLPRGCYSLHTILPMS